MLHALVSILVIVPSITSLDPAELPTIDVKVAPPNLAFPEVMAEVRRLDHVRESAESALMQRLNAVYAAAVKDAQSRVDHLVETAMAPAIVGRLPGGHVAFLGQRSRNVMASATPAFTAKLHLIPRPTPDSSLQKHVDELESARAEVEQRMFQEACEEMRGLTSIVLSELGRALATRFGHSRQLASMASRPLSFLGSSQRVAVSGSSGLPEQANIRISAGSEAYPRLSELIQDMEMRRDRAETQERSTILDMEMRLLKAEQDMISRALRRVLV